MPTPSNHSTESHDVAVQPPDGALRRFRQLVLATGIASFLLVIVGGLVRLTDAGLGCGPAGAGTHGWPLCNGKLIPNASTHTMTEYGHRFLATIVIMLLAVVLWQAIRQFKDRPEFKGWALAAMVIVIGQAVLGGLTVEYGLHAGLVAAHLGTAMLLLTVLICLYASVVQGARRSDATGADLAKGSRALLVAGIIAGSLLLATIVAGGVVAGTENHGVPGSERTVGAHYACAQEFPTCVGSVLPFGRSEMADIQLTHRSLMFLATIAILTFAVLLYRRRSRKMALAIAAVVLAQVLLGAINVWADKSVLLVLAHLTVGTTLWILVSISIASMLDLNRTRTDAFT